VLLSTLKDDVTSTAGARVVLSTPSLSLILSVVPIVIVVVLSAVDFSVASLDVGDLPASPPSAAGLVCCDSVSLGSLRATKKKMTRSNYKRIIT
jgi:hypothetical protein